MSALKRGTWHTIMPVLALIMLIAFIYISTPLMFKSGPTGLTTEDTLQNQPPQWTSPYTTFVVAQTLQLDLSAFFKDPEGQPLTFIATKAENLTIDLQDNQLTITPDTNFVGERVIAIRASDGETVATQRVSIEVPPSSQTTTASSPSSFSSESFTTQNVVNGCAVINASSSLIANVNATGSCFVINASNIFLNCSGFNITGDTTGTGISVTSQQNVTIKHCRIINFSTGIGLSNANNITIQNTTATTIGGRALLLTNTSNSMITQAALDFSCFLFSSCGALSLEAASNNNIITHSRIVTVGQFGTAALRSAASHNGTAINNTFEYIPIAAPSNGRAAAFFGSENWTIINNTFIAPGGAFGISGIALEFSDVAFFNLSRNNLSSPNGVGLSMNGTSLIPKLFNHSIDATNIADGFPLYYFFSQSNFAQENASGEILIAFSENITVRNIPNEIPDGIRLFGSKNISIRNTTVNASGRRNDALVLVGTNASLVQKSSIKNTCEGECSGIVLSFSHNVTVNGSFFNSTVQFDGGTLTAFVSHNLIVNNSLLTSAKRRDANVNLLFSDLAFFENSAIISNQAGQADGILRAVIFDSSSFATMRTTNISSPTTEGLLVRGSTISHFNHSIDTTNTADGFTLFYFFNQSNFVLAGNASGQIYVVFSNNVTLRDVPTRITDGVKVISASNNILTNLTIDFSTTGGGTGLGLATALELNNASGNVIERSRINSTVICAVGCSAISLNKLSAGNIIRHSTINQDTGGGFEAPLLFFSNAHNNTLLNNSLFARARRTSGTAIIDFISSSGNVIANSVLTGAEIVGDNQITMTRFFASDNNVILNSAMNLSFAPQFTDIAAAISGTNTILNTTINNKSNMAFSGTARINFSWFLDVKAQGADGSPFGNVKVNITDVDGLPVFNGVTGSNGFIPQQALLEFFRNATLTKFKSNYTVNATINPTQSQQVNLTASMLVTFTYNASIQQVILNSTFGTGATLNISTTAENLTAIIINATDTITNITDWRRNGTGIALLNMPFDTNISGLGALTRDYSGSGNNGTLGDGSAGTAPIWTPRGNVSGAYVFDGINDVIRTQSALTLPSAGPLTATMWIKPRFCPATFGVDICTVMDVSESFNSWKIFQEPLTNLVFCQVGAMPVPIAAVSPVAVPLNAWTHIACVVNGTNVLLYIDGNLVNVSPSVTPNISSDIVNIGAEIDAGFSGRNFNGTIDEFRIYGRALSSQQVASIFEEERSGRQPLRIVSQELQAGEVWQACATPNNQLQDGATVCSNNVTIVAHGSVCGTLATSATMTQNLTANGTCFTIGANNIFLNCSGFSIGGNGTGIGINATNRLNITIRDCVLNNFSTGIHAREVNNSFFINNSASNSTSSAFALILSNNNRVTNNTLRGLSAGIGLFVQSSRNNTLIDNNATGGTSNHGISVTDSSNNVLTNNRGSTAGAFDGIALESTSQNNTLTNNVGHSIGGKGISLSASSNNNVLIGSNGTSSGSGGIALVSSSNNTFIASNGVGIGSANGIALSSSHNNIFINSSGSSSSDGDGISLALSTNNTFTNARGTSSLGRGAFLASAGNNAFTKSIFSSNMGEAIRISSASSGNNSFNTTTLFTNTTWILTSSAGSDNNLTNTTFEGSNGSIRIIPTVTLFATVTTDLARLNISFNQAFLNSSNLSFLNVSAQITLRNITFTDPQPLLDINDDGIFEICSPPQCVEESFVNGTFVFNVSSFTIYSSQETPAAPVQGGGSSSRAAGFRAPPRPPPIVEKPTPPPLPVILPPNMSQQDRSQSVQEAGEPSQPELQLPASRAASEVLKPEPREVRIADFLTIIFYSLAFLAVIGLSAYWYVTRHRSPGGQKKYK